MLPSDDGNPFRDATIGEMLMVQAERVGDREAIVQGETYHWHDGDAVMFDDTFLHDAANETDQVRVVLFLDAARKMPWPLALLTRLFLWIAHQDKSVREIRANAKIKAA